MQSCINKALFFYKIFFYWITDLITLQEIFFIFIFQALGLQISTTKTLLVPCPTIMGTYVKLFFWFCEANHMPMETDFQFHNFLAW